MAGKGTKNNQQNTQGDAQTEQAVQTKPLDFDVRIHSIKPNESIKGTASVNINGAFAIRGVKIIEGSNGLFVSMPSYKVGNEYKDICFPITQECRCCYIEARLLDMPSTLHLACLLQMPEEMSKVPFANCAGPRVGNSTVYSVTFLVTFVVHVACPKPPAPIPSAQPTGRALIFVHVVHTHNSSD